jgi:dolichyl-phosphate-mannose-protein mannosyltransferase
MLRSRAYCPQTAFVLALLVFGVALRFTNLGFPEHFRWDEHHFVENARNYLQGKEDWNDHPPLGKLLMALSLHLLGDTSLASRLPSALLGTWALVAAALLGRSVFSSSRAGLFAAAFLSVDGFHIAYSRSALLDGLLTSLSLTTLWLMTRPGLLAAILTGLALGSALNVKFSAITLLAPFFGLLALRGAALTGLSWFEGRTLFGRPLRGTKGDWFGALLVLPVAASTYTAWWSFGLRLQGLNAEPLEGWRHTIRLLGHHARATDWKHPFLSHWWTWFAPTKPIILSQEETANGMWRVLTTMGNPLLWWMGAIGIVLIFESLCKDAFLGRRQSKALLGHAWLALGFFAYLAPWIFTNRDSYIYHYLPAYSLALVALGGHFSQLTKQKDRLLVTATLCVVGLVSAYYAPVWADLPLSEAALKWRPFIGK